MLLCALLLALPVNSRAAQQEHLGGMSALAALAIASPLQLPGASLPSALPGLTVSPLNGIANAQAPAALPARAQGKIALIQYDADKSFGDYDRNLRELTRMAEASVAQGAKIVVMPEGSLYGYASQDELWCKPGMTEFLGKKCRDVSAVAERLPEGRSAAYWADFSKRHGVFVLFNLPEADGKAFYNAMGVVGPAGYVATYRKRLLYKTDQAYATAGTEPVVLKTPYGCFGLLVCLDADPRAPHFEEYKALQADAIIIAMSWDDDPLGSYAAKKKFREWAQLHGIDIYASDSAPWDGTGKYPASGTERERNGLPDDGVGVPGVSSHGLKYR